LVSGTCIGPTLKPSIRENAESANTTEIRQAKQRAARLEDPGQDKQTPLGIM
jgi:hypothetical protein